MLAWWDQSEIFDLGSHSFKKMVIFAQNNEIFGKNQNQVLVGYSGNYKLTFIGLIPEFCIKHCHSQFFFFQFGINFIIEGYDMHGVRCAIHSHRPVFQEAE